MKPQPSEELLSAYLDGAVTPDERRDVESWLEESPEARRTLNEFGRLSNSLRGLPRHQAPPEFAAQVLKNVEMRMLLPARPAPGTKDRSRRSHWLAMAAPVGAIAALLAFAFLLVPRLQLQEQRDVAAHTQPLADSQQQLPQDTADVAEAVAVNDRQPSASARTAPPPGSSRSLPVPKVAPQPGAKISAGAPARSRPAADAPRVGAMPASPANISADDESGPSLPLELNFTEADVGRVHQVIRRNASGQQVGVIHLYVFDRAQGLAAVQQALTQKDVPARSQTEGASQSLKRATVAATSPETGNMAILVQATDQQIADAFMALVERNKRDDTVVASMRMDQPYDLGDMDETVRQMIETYSLNADLPQSAAASDKSPAATESATRGRSDSGKNVPAAGKTAAGGQSKPVEPPAEPADSKSDKTGRRAQSTVAGRVERKGGESTVGPGHAIVPWPPVAAEKGSRKSDAVALAKKPSGPELERTENAKAAVDSASLSQNKREVTSPEPAGVQVIIVIEQFPPGAGKPSPPQKTPPRDGDAKGA